MIDQNFGSLLQRLGRFNRTVGCYLDSQLIKIGKPADTCRLNKVIYLING